MASGYSVRLGGQRTRFDSPPAAPTWGVAHSGAGRSAQPQLGARHPRSHTPSMHAHLHAPGDVLACGRRLRLLDRAHTAMRSNRLCRASAMAHAARMVPGSLGHTARPLSLTDTLAVPCMTCRGARMQACTHACTTCLRVTLPPAGWFSAPRQRYALPSERQRLKPLGHQPSVGCRQRSRPAEPAR